MHELSVAEALVKSLRGYVAEHGGRICKLKLTLGRLSGVDPEALRFVWPAALAVAGDRALAGCELEMNVLPLAFVCRSCGAGCRAEQLRLDCPACGRESLVRSGGRELLIESIEVEQNV